MNTIWFPNGKTSRQVHPKTPAKRLQDTPRRLQDASKTLPGRFQDSLKSFRNRTSLLSRFRGPKLTSKHIPRCLQKSIQDLSKKLQDNSTTCLEYAPKTPPGRFQIVLNSSRFLSLFCDPKMISKNVPTSLENTSRTILRP